MAKPNPDDPAVQIRTSDEERVVQEQLTKLLMDQGLLIEAGWTALRRAAIPPDAPDVQIQEMRKSFFAGAQHLFASIMIGLDPDKEPTEQDLRRMDLIGAELAGFLEQMIAESAGQRGAALQEEARRARAMGEQEDS